MLTETVRFALLGGAAGSALAILAMGVNVVYRASRVLNFSQAAIAIAAAYAYAGFAEDLPVPVAMLAAIAAGMVVGALVDALVMRPLRTASSLTKAIGTIGVLIVVQALLNIVYGYRPVVVQSWLPTTTVEVAGVAVGMNTLLTIVIGVVVAGALHVCFGRSMFGLASVALSHSPRSLAALGTYSPTRVATANWALSGGIAAFAGVLIAPVTTLAPTLALILVVPVLSVALIGNLTSFWLTLLGGVLVGVAQALLGVNTDLPGAQDALPFLVIAVLLTLRGTSMPARGEVAERLPLIASGRIPWVGLSIAAVLALVVIWAAPDQAWVSSITVTLAVSTVLLSLVVVTGYAGQLNLASFAFAGVAALVAASCIALLGWPFPLAALAGVVATIPVGLLVGLPAVRTRGTSLAVITLGFAVVFQSMVANNETLGGGLSGLFVGKPSLFGIPLDAVGEPRGYATFTLLVFIATGLAVLGLRRSAAGRRMVAVRGNEAAAASIGVSVARTKLTAFVLSAMVAGVGGILIAFMNQIIRLGNPGGRFDPSFSINAISQQTVGGIGWVSGSIFGALMEPGAVLNRLLLTLSQGSWLNLISGVLLLFTVVTAPAGVAAIQSGFANKVAGLLPGNARRAARRAARVPRIEAPTSHADDVRPASLAVRGLTVAFGRTTVLHGIDIDIRPGTVLGVIGPNGAGKTTLLEAVTGFNRPSAGTVLLDGEDISSASPARRARLGVARSFQSLELFEDLSVLDNLVVAADQAGGPSGVAGLSGAARAAIVSFGLEDRLQDQPSDLSYGERRLLAITRALATRPRVLLLDEPAAGLGLQERADLKETVRTIAHDWGIAVFLIEHDVDLVMGVSDEVVALDFGRVIARGTPAEVRQSPEVIAAYLGVEDPDDVPAAAAVAGIGDEEEAR